MVNKHNELEITQNGDWHNIDHKKMENGDSILITKLFPSGIEKIGKGKNNETYKYYIVRAVYKETEVSFFLYEQPHGAFSECGGVDDTIKMTKKEEIYTKKDGNKAVKTELVFEKVEA